MSEEIPHHVPSDDAPDPESRAGGDDRSLGQRTLDALVFAPAGFLLTAVEDLPEMAAKGRTRLEGQVRNAHVLGRFAVAYGRQDIERRLARLTAARDATPEEASDPEPEAGPADGPAARAELAPSPPSPPIPARLHAVPPAGDANLAIPDYDTLSASQVVRRLDGLGPQELGAVYRHEAATRGRRTILHRAQQLLGSEDVPGR